MADEYKTFDVNDNFMQSTNATAVILPENTTLPLASTTPHEEIILNKYNNNKFIVTQHHVQ